MTSATVGDILRYVRYIAGEDVKGVELPGSFFVFIYMRQSPGLDASPSPDTTIVVEPITINVEKLNLKANPFDVR